MDKTLLCLAGLPGTGKSSICKELATREGYAHVDIDDYKKVVVDPNKVIGQVDPPYTRWEYCKMAIDEALRLFDNGAIVVVLDEVFPYREVRNNVEDFRKALRIKVRWIEVKTPKEVAIKRLLLPRGDHILDPENAGSVYEMCAEVFEPFEDQSQNYVVLVNDGDSNVPELVLGYC